MIPQVKQNVSLQVVEEIMDSHGCPIVQVLIPNGSRYYSVHRQRLLNEFSYGLRSLHEKGIPSSAICTVGAIRFSALRFIISEGLSFPVDPLESFPFDALTESLRGRAYFQYLGVLVIREEGHMNAANPFRFV